MRSFARIGLALSLALAGAGSAAGQSLEYTAPQFKFEPLQAQPVISTLPSLVSPNILTPRLNNYQAPEPLKLELTSKLSDSLRALPELNATHTPTHVEPAYDFATNPHWHDWSASGTIMPLGDLTLSGAGGYSTLPGLGNTGSAALMLSGVWDERLTLAVGATGVKYHYGRSAWNDFGVNAQASYQLTDRLSLNAFGEHYFDTRFGGIAAMSYTQVSRYGGALGIKISDKVKMNVGAQRYYDPYRRQWVTIPILAPEVTVLGMPLSWDFGGLVWNVLNKLFNGKRSDGRQWYMGSGSGSSPKAPNTKGWVGPDNHRSVNSGGWIGPDTRGMGGSGMPGPSAPPPGASSRASMPNFKGLH